VAAKQPANIPKVVVVFDGQSLNILPGGNAGMPYKLMIGQSRAARYIDPALISIGGHSWTQLSTNQAQRCNIYANSGLTTILVMNGGTSDITLEGDIGTTIYANERDYALAAKAAGFDKVLICTTTKSNGMTTNQNTRRQNGNDLVIGNADGAFDAIVDLACDSTLSNPGAGPSGNVFYGTGHLADPTSAYYQDGVHWSGNTTPSGTLDAAMSIGPALTFLGGT
jgi:hypothetical protein